MATHIVHPVSQIRDRDNHVLEDRRFMVLVWGPGGQGPSTTLVMVDHEGNLVDLLYCGQLSGAIRQPPGLDRSYEWKHAMQETHKVSLKTTSVCSRLKVTAAQLLPVHS